MRGSFNDFHSRTQALETLCCVLCWIASVVSNSLQYYGPQSARLLCPRDSPGKSTGVGYPALLQGIFLNQAWNPCLLHWQAGSLPLAPRGKQWRFYLTLISITTAAAGWESETYTWAFKFSLGNDGTSLKAQLVKNLQCRRPWFDSWVGKIPWKRDRLPIPVFLDFGLPRWLRQWGIRLQCRRFGFNP